MNAPLHTECERLMELRIVPSEVCRFAARLHCEALLISAFPTMPTSMREELLLGTHHITRDAYDDWSVVAK